jgi:hypothetical protein
MSYATQINMVYDVERWIEREIGPKLVSNDMFILSCCYDICYAMTDLNKGY